MSRSDIPSQPQPLPQQPTSSADHWEIINLPAIATQDEYIDGELFRRKGEALAPELKSLSYLESFRSTMDSWAWEATMQGNPLNPAGFYWAAELFDDSIFVEEMPELLRHLVVGVDPATGKRRTSASSDYTAIVAIGVTGDGYIYIDAHLEKMAFTPTIEAIGRMSGRLPRRIDLIGIEENGFQGELAIQAEKTLRTDFGIYCPIVTESNSTRKDLRIQSMDPQVQKRTFRFVDNEHTRLVVNQFKNFGFPGVHDDGPDAVEMTLRVLQRQALSDE